MLQLDGYLIQLLQLSSENLHGMRMEKETSKRELLEELSMDIIYWHITLILKVEVTQLSISKFMIMH